MSNDETRTTQHTGGCHCGAVRFEVKLDRAQPGSRCNCTLCTKVNGTGAFAKPADFTLLSGAESVTEYRVHAGSMHRSFCKHCGVHVFGGGSLPELGGEFVSINLQSVDGFEPIGLAVQYWDGRHDNWHAGPRDAPWPISRG